MTCCLWRRSQLPPRAIRGESGCRQDPRITGEVTSRTCRFPTRRLHRPHQPANLVQEGCHRRPACAPAILFHTGHVQGSRVTVDGDLLNPLPSRPAGGCHYGDLIIAVEISTPPTRAVPPAAVIDVSRAFKGALRQHDRNSIPGVLRRHGDDTRRGWATPCSIRFRQIENYPAATAVRGI